jgi:hypothetical protein
MLALNAAIKLTVMLLGLYSPTRIISYEMISAMFFWVVTLCGHQRFRETYCLEPPPKCWYLPTSPYGVTTQKTSTDIFTAVRTSNLIREIFLLQESREAQLE